MFPFWIELSPVDLLQWTGVIIALVTWFLMGLGTARA
jgi:hypothetical protein